MVMRSPWSSLYKHQVLTEAHLPEPAVSVPGVPLPAAPSSPHSAPV